VQKFGACNKVVTGIIIYPCDGSVMPSRKFVVAVYMSAVCSTELQAKEYPIGKPYVTDGLEIAAVYLQPVTMEPAGMMRPADDSDIHLEADIHATENNQQGFAEGDWLPYLQVKFELLKVGSSHMMRGTLMPMVANDGPHYGDNIKLFGPGKYKLTLIVSPPSESGHQHFGRHVDKETGVKPWFAPIKSRYEFVYAGIGKKGGY
jgi:uncharacterized protein involved in high-affinity Fe2+ transport